MPPIEVRAYFSKQKNVPIMEFLQDVRLKDAASYARCLALIKMLRERGSELRKPHSKKLRDGIFELRALAKIPCRILYFFRPTFACLSHGIIKKRDDVPNPEIERAISHRRFIEGDPENHTTDFNN
jgi:hypothetical protein